MKKDYLRQFSLLLLTCFLAVFLFVSNSQGAVITDSDGKDITFNAPFKRIISLYAAHTENLYELGLTDEVVGVNRGDRFFNKEIPRLSFRDDAERFIALKPDLVLIRPMLSRAYPGMVKRLQDNGITVISLQPTTVQGMFQYWRELGLLTGREKSADRMIARFKKSVADIKQKVSIIPESKRKKVYFESIHSKMKTFAQGSTAIYALETAGGINIAADAARVRNTNIAFYGKERILAKASQIDVYLAQHGRMNPVTVEDIINTPGFQVIKAVRDGQVFLIEEAIVSRPVPAIIKGIRQIYNLLYGNKAHE